VSQVSRTFTLQMKEDEDLRIVIDKLREVLGSSEMWD
jgi:hypothetical protein